MSTEIPLKNPGRRPRKILFLDLEDTVVTPVLGGWQACELIRPRQLRDFIEEVKADEVIIFSFAIGSQGDKEAFNKLLRPFLEERLGVKFDEVLTVDDDILPACAKAMGLLSSVVTFDEVVSFWSKHESFRLFVKERFKKETHRPVEVILLDDAVLEEDFEWPSLGIKGKLRRPQDLP